MYVCTAARTRRIPPPRRPAATLVLAAAVLLAAGCGDDDSETGTGTLIESSGSGSGDGVPPDTSSGDVGGDVGDGTTLDDQDETALPAIPPGRDDRPGLRVRFPGDREPGALVSPWLAEIDVFQIFPRPTTTGDIEVELLRYADGLDFPSAADFYTPDLDSCRIRDLDAPDEETGGGEEDVDDGVRLVGGGETLTLSSAGGAWLSVPYSRESRLYEADDAFPAAIPDDLTLSLPGAEFPRIEALALEAPPVPERLSPAIDEPVTPVTEYRWVAGDDDTLVRIVFKNYADDAQEDFRGFAVSCRVRDDGAFELPEDVLAALAGLPGVTTTRYVREARLLEFRDGIIAYRGVDIADD